MATNVNLDQLDSLGLTRREPLKKQQLGQDDFMKLMTTQLTNQDPFKPMESGEFLGQIAQFSQVSGLETLNENFNSLKESLYSNQAFQASALVGRSVLVPGVVGMLSANQGAMVGAVNVPSGADDVVVEISDAVGQRVKSFSLGAQRPGKYDFAWDGSADNGTKMEPGFYSIKATAKVSGTEVGADTMVQAQVDSVGLGGSSGSVSLNLFGLGERDFKDVLEIR